MFCVYIIYSEKLNRFYIGSSDNYLKRLNEHNLSKYIDSLPVKGIPWNKYTVIDNLDSKQAIAIEKHIKKMKSRKFIENLILFPDIIQNLVQKYKT